MKTLCPYVLSTCDASNECVAWSAIDRNHINNGAAQVCWQMLGAKFPTCELDAEDARTPGASDKS
jgi:hypothetical protein